MYTNDAYKFDETIAHSLNFGFSKILELRRKLEIMERALASNPNSVVMQDAVEKLRRDLSREQNIFDNPPSKEDLAREAAELEERSRKAYEERCYLVSEIGYAEYLKTPHWKDVARRAKERAGNRCQVCYSPDMLNAHHRTYDRIGQELDTDITVLCHDCHELFSTHGRLRR